MKGETIFMLLLLGGAAYLLYSATSGADHQHGAAAGELWTTGVKRERLLRHPERTAHRKCR